MSEPIWCDEKYPDLSREIRLLWYWISRYPENETSEIDIGDRIDRVLSEIIMKSKGEL